MNPLTALVFFLAFGSLNCSLVVESAIKKQCMKQEGVTENDLNTKSALDQMNVKCFYHCKFEKEGIIANGYYIGNDKYCKDVKDANKCELGAKVHVCTNLSSIFS